MRFQDIIVLELYHGLQRGRATINRKIWKLGSLVRKRRSFKLQTSCLKASIIKETNTIKEKPSALQQDTERGPWGRDPTYQMLDLPNHKYISEEFFLRTPLKGFPKQPSRYTDASTAVDERTKLLSSRQVELNSIVHVMLVLWIHITKTWGIYSASNTRQCVAEPNSLQGDPENPLHEAVKMKPKFQ